MAKDSVGGTASGSYSEESRIISAIAYVLGIVVAVLILLLRKDDRYTKFHALQAIMLDLAIMVCSGVLGVVLFALLIVFGIATLGIGFFLGFWAVWLFFFVIAILIFLIRLFLAYEAYKGKTLKLPVIGAHAERIAAG